MDGAPRSDRSRQWAALGAALAVAAMGVLAWPFTVDDAWILAQYARNLVQHGSYSVGGGPPTDGVTGPLWLLPMAGALAAGLPPMDVSKMAGLVCVALAAAWAARVGGWSAAGITAVQPTLGIWGVAGLETGAATLALSLVAQGSLFGREPRPSLAGGAAVALAWLRPEALVCGAVLWAVLGRRDPRRALQAGLIAGFGIALLVVFRFSLFATPLPLAWSAKPGLWSNGIGYVGRALVGTGMAVGALVLAWGVHRGDGIVRGLAWAVGAHLVAVALAGGDWMPGYRLLAPVLPLYAVGVARGLRTLGAPRRRRVVVPGLLLVCALPVADAFAQLPDVRAAGRARQRVGRPFGEWLGRHYESLALVDIGFLGWVSGAEVVDLAGLTDPTIARAPGGHLSKRIDPGYLAERDPDAFVLHSWTEPEFGPDGRLKSLSGYPVERHVAGLGWVRRHYRVRRVVQYSERYFYVVLQRR